MPVRVRPAAPFALKSWFTNYSRRWEFIISTSEMQTEPIRGCYWGEAQGHVQLNTIDSQNWRRVYGI